MERASTAESARPVPDGVHAMVPMDRMDAQARKVRAIYAITPGAPTLHGEFGFMEGTLELWHEQGMPNVKPGEFAPFGFERGGSWGLGQLGWCEAALVPAFETKVLEDRGEYELVQDHAGRAVLCFKGRRQGFMPEYVDHPVKDQRSWEEQIKWRLDPTTAQRYATLDERMARGRAAAAEGKMIVASAIGGYMYLRSLMGPEELLYAFVDQPALIHDCMRTWFELADAVTARHQEHLTIDELFLAEDICYNSGPLISPDMMREFLLPYYQQLIANMRSRQIDRTRHLYIQIDTDGNANPVIDVYKEIGMDVMSPFEVASGCDVMEIGMRHRDLVIRGGIDKRVLAQGKAAIDRMVERILPPLIARGGYIPCCDHSVPNEVRFDDYLHYRRRCLELGG